MDLLESAILVMARQPIPGECKTRLSKHLSVEQACAFHDAFLRDTIDFVTESEIGGRFLAYWPPAGRDWFAATFVGIDLIQQTEDDLGASISTAFDQAFALGYSAVIAIGADTPDLPAGTMVEALKALDECDVVIGPAEDGGYYLIGLNAPAPELFRRIEWGTPAVTEQTMKHAAELGLQVKFLDEWYDVDEIDQLRRLAESKTLREHSRAALEGIEL